LKLHPRHHQRRDGSIALLKCVLELSEKHKLSFLEIIVLLTEQITRLTRYEIIFGEEQEKEEEDKYPPCQHPQGPCTCYPGD